MIRVLLVDDHQLVRQGTRALLTTAPDIEIVAESEDGDEALALARRLQPDLVLLDIRLRGSSGIEVARTLRQDLPHIKVVILTAYHHEQYVRALFAIGVHGYLLKDATGDQVIAAVRRVYEGELVVSPEIEARKRHSTLTGADQLSNRELEVLTLVSRGESNKEIAQSLGVNTRTVETYVSRLMGKLDARSRTEAISVATQRGIIHLEG